MNSSEHNPALHLREETLHEYLDHALPPPEQARVAQHLADCAACRQRLAQLEALFSILAQTEEAPLPRDFTKEILIRLPLGGRQPAPLPWPLLVAQAALALLLAALAGQLLLPEIAWTSLEQTWRQAFGWMAASLLDASHRWSATILQLTAEAPKQASALLDQAPLGQTGLALPTAWWFALLAAAGVCWLAALYWGLALPTDEPTGKHRRNYD